jgi:threonine dehydrogenase-like Zn-dependent dehydrogenase
MGAFAEYFNAREDIVFPLPLGLDTKTGALAEPLSVSIHALSKIPDQNRKRLLILGSGTIGMLSLRAAQSMGFEKIVTTDVVEYNLKTAKENGAFRVVNVAKENLQMALQESFDGKKADAVLITAGAPNIIDQALESTKVLGTIVFLAMIVPPLTVGSYPIVFKELTVVGSMNYTRFDFQKAIDIIAAAPHAFGRLITHCFDFFTEGQKAFEMMDKKTEGFVKVFLKF